MSNVATSPTKTPTRIPVQSVRQWVTLALALVIVMIATMYKDWWLTGVAPNVWFYVFMPPVDILGSTLVMYIAVRILRQPVKFLELLAITLSMAIVMQLVEIITKLVYYKVWEYPGILYLLLVFPLWFLLTTYALVRFTGMKWTKALLVAIAGLVGSLLTAGTFQAVTGPDTPGS